VGEKIYTKLFKKK